VSGIVEGLTEGIWTTLSTSFGRIWSSGIKITSPRPRETLGERAHGQVISYVVRGKLGRLPKGHAIWLLTQDETSGQVWPQGEEVVQFDQDKGEWSGIIIERPNKSVRIIAVVAPPTSCDLFNYYQKVGKKTNYEALQRVPVECRDRDEVQARVP
jgi:hypothetical protein